MPLRFVSCDFLKIERQEFFYTLSIAYIERINVKPLTFVLLDAYDSIQNALHILAFVIFS